MKLAHFDTAGLPLGFYDTALHGPVTIDGARNPAIPADAIEISDAVWAAFLGQPVGSRRWQNGSVVVVEMPASMPVVPGSATKLGLKRALADQGGWDSVKAALAADPDLQEDWDLATEIRRSDPLTQAMIAQLGTDRRPGRRAPDPGGRAGYLTGRDQGSPPLPMSDPNVARLV